MVILDSFAKLPGFRALATTNGREDKAESPKITMTTCSSKRSSIEERANGVGGLFK